MATRAHVRGMHNRGVWIGFLVSCFALTGLVGLFGTYATSIPLERAMHRYAVLDEALATDPPDQAAIRNVLGKEAAPVLDGPGPLAVRVARARAGVRAEAEEEQQGVAARSRLMLGTITVLAAGLGTGILLLATRRRQPSPAAGRGLENLSGQPRRIGPDHSGRPNSRR